MYPGRNTYQSAVFIHIHRCHTKAIRLYVQTSSPDQPYIPVDTCPAVPSAASGAAFYGYQNIIVCAVLQIISDIYRKVRIAIGTLPHLGLVDEHTGIAVDPLKLQHHMTALIVFWNIKPLVILVLACIDIPCITAVCRPLLLLLMEHGIMGQIHLLRIIWHAKHQFEWIHILPYFPAFVKAYSFH